jgi:antitoxin YefM
MARHIPYALFAKHLPRYMEKVRNRPVHIRRNEDAVVLMSEEEYEGLMETIHLLSNPANAKDLLDGIAEAKAGKFVEHDLIEG